MRGMAALRIAALALALCACGGRADGRADGGANRRGLPNAVLLDQHGAPRRFYDDVVSGHSVVIQFMYTRCDGVCPAATDSMVAAQERLRDRLGKDLRFVSISLDSERDAPEDLADYAAAHGMDESWILLTGAADDVEGLRRALGAYDPDPIVDQDRANHSASLVIGNDRRDCWTMVSGLGPAAAIERSVRRIL